MSSLTDPSPASEGKLRVLMAHSRYQLRGGEDIVFENECAVLREHGHTVIEYARQNEEVEDLPPLALARDTVWSKRTYRELRELIRSEKPDVAHFHNILPLISPSAYHACRHEGVPVVQTLHNYRTMCLNALLFREGEVCETCVGKRFALAGIRHRCYRKNRGASAAVAWMTAFHWLKGTWTEAVDRYVCLTEFSMQMHARAGLPRPKLFLKPNFLRRDPGFSQGPDEPRAMFLGRISPEKGLAWLLEAWSSHHMKVPLVIVGDGPQRAELEQKHQSTHIIFMGSLSWERCLEELSRSSLLLMSSHWYEGFPQTILEAMACGTPAIVPQLGGMPEVAKMGAGRAYQPRDAIDLVTQVQAILDLSPTERAEERRRARAAFERHFSPEVGYQNLINLYQAAQGGIVRACPA